MHHNHVHDDLLLLHILFARKIHEHVGIPILSISFALMHIAKIHVTLAYSVKTMHSHAPIFHIHMIAYM